MGMMDQDIDVILDILISIFIFFMINTIKSGIKMIKYRDERDWKIIMRDG